MKFQLSKESTGRSMTRFHVTNARGEVCGVINVAKSDAEDLQRHWHAAPTAPAKAAAGGKAAIVAALRRGPRLSKAALLRGC